MLEERLGDVPQRIGARRSVGRDLQRSFRGNIFLRLARTRFDGRLDRLADDRADLRRQARVQDELAVHVVEVADVALLVLELRELRGVAPLRPAILAHELLDVRRRAVARDVHEHRFVRRRRDARHRANLRVGDLALRERVRDLGQLLERARDAHLLARRDGADAALPVQPLRRVGEPVALERFLAIELARRARGSDTSRRSDGPRAP